MRALSTTNRWVLIAVLPPPTLRHSLQLTSLPLDAVQPVVSGKQALVSERGVASVGNRVESQLRQNVFGHYRCGAPA
jgi:hypothetical protein